jgi:D-alanyl-D-alanine carboxypeptidase
MHLTRFIPISLVRAVLTSALLGFALSVISIADEADSASQRERIEELVASTLERPGAVGLSVAVATGDEFLLAGGYGVAEAEHDVPVNVDTMFRIGSVTKQFTAAAIMALVEKEEMALEDNLTTYLPAFPEQGEGVQVLHLLTHTSGIKSYTDLGEKWLEVVSRELSHEQLLALFKDEPAAFAPGERFAYNNSGYYVLGMIIEEVSGQSYAEHLQTALFEPLDLKRTRYGSNRDLIKNRAQGYRIIDGQLANDALIGMSQPGAAGALLSTAKDLVRWQLALVDGKVVSSDSYEMMSTSFMLNDFSETKYGFGLTIAVVDGHPVVQHGGGIFGFNSMLAYFPEEELSVAVISNSEACSAGQLAAKIARIMLD